MNEPQVDKKSLRLLVFLVSCGERWVGMLNHTWLYNCGKTLLRQFVHRHKMALLPRISIPHIKKKINKHQTNTLLFSILFRLFRPNITKCVLQGKMSQDWQMKRKRGQEEQNTSPKIENINTIFFRNCSIWHIHSHLFITLRVYLEST